MWIRNTLLAVLVGRSSAVHSHRKDDCVGLAQLTFADLNVTVLSSTLYAAGTTIQIKGGQSTYCQAEANTTVDICRFTADIHTTSDSNTYVEVWLPRKQHGSWNGKFVATGNAGLDGCLDYRRLSHTSGLGIAVISDNGGHHGHGSFGEPFLHHNEVIVDFAHRARHSAVVLGKQVVQKYYSKPIEKSYYWGCSTAGRQGLKAAQTYPEDFDGIIAGAPAADFNHLASWAGHFLTLTGSNSSDPRYLMHDQWQNVHDEVIRQCDMLDGVADGIIEDTSICNFKPETLLCMLNDNAPGCLTVTQAQTVRAVFTPLYGIHGEYLYPRLSPSSEIGAASYPMASLNGIPGFLPTGWFRNAIYNNPDWDPTTLNPLDFAYADSLDAKHGAISSWSGNLTAFRARGGKLITFHGYSDALIPAENTLRYYHHVANTMALNETGMDTFFRHFPISGMGHCISGNGAWAFGQDANAKGPGADDLLLRLIEWVENDTAPKTLTGVKWVDGEEPLRVDFQRTHCRYPFRTTYKGKGYDPQKLDSWKCVPIKNWNACVGSTNGLPKLC